MGVLIILFALNLIAVVYLIYALERIREAVMTALEELAAAVTEIKGRADSLIALVNGLSQYIRDHAGDPAAIIAYADELEAKAAEVAAAVEANPIPPSI